MQQFKVKSSTLKKGFFCLFVPAMFYCKHLSAQLTGFAYGRSITIQGSQISGTQTNFPVLISLTDNSLRQSPTGRLRNANGWDIAFTLPDCSTILPMQIERYDAAAGTLVAWVRLPSLVSGNNQIIYMFYGKTGVASDPSSATVWDGNYMGVYHFNNSFTDGTSNNRHLNNTGTTNLTASKIGEGRRLNNTPNITSGTAGVQYLQLPDNIFNTVTNFTFEGWVYLETVNTSWERIFDFGRNTTFNMFLCPSIEGNGVKRFAITVNGNGTERQVSSTTTTGTGGWHHFAVTIDAAANTGVLYYDGTANATNSGGMTLTPGSIGNTDRNYFGISQYTADHGLYGSFDEFRISNTTRSADWILTSYRNQNTPSSFYTVASEVAAGALCTVLPLQITSFGAIPAQAGTVTVRWVTENESAADKYILERSANGTNWEAIKTITATSNGSVQKYVTQDANPLYPTSYYRLQQVTAGRTIYSQMAVLKMDEVFTNIFIASPNPAHESINITFRENVLPQNINIELLSNTGVRVSVKPDHNGNTISMKLPALSNGIYFLNVYIKGIKHTRKILIVQ
jgi:biopolymer transport protein ExbB